MNRIRTSIMIILGILAMIVAVLLGSVLYITRYKVVIVDTARSADRAYEVILQSVGEPGWPFGSALGQLVLKKDEIVVSRTNFKIANDGASFSERAWSVTWYDDYVEIILSGSEQLDELMTLYYDGQVECSRLTTHYGVESESASNNIVEDATDTEDDSENELFPDEWQITAGYQAIYELLSDSPMEDFKVYYGASESFSRCILSEDENTVEYLVYNGKSENEHCGLYVHYQSEQNNDGTCSDTDGTIVDIYAYVYESGDIVSSGKTQWETIGSEAYQKVTGEK